MNNRLLRTLALTGIYIFYFPLVLFTCLIVWLDRKIGFPLSFPRDVAALAKQRQWCVDELKKGGALPQDAQVNEYKVTPMPQEIIFRSNAGIVEIDYTRNGERKRLKCFAKFAPTQGSVWNRTIFNLQLNHIKESFFNQYFANADKSAQSPTAYCSKMSVITGNLCLITEFMDDCVHYLDCAYDRFPDEHLALAIQGMSTLHAHYWKDSSKRMEKILPIPDSAVYLFDSLIASSWSKTARTILVQSWRRMNEFQTILHGDSRVGNMMFPSAGKGRFVFIDWQAVRRGRAVYDLAYFLILSLTTDHRRAVEKQSVETYYRQLMEKGVNYPREEMEDDYRHACLCVLVLLSLPMLSGEASVEGEAAKIFAWGMNIWRERLKAKFTEFDYPWMARHYGMTEQEGREAVAEMLGVIEKRLSRIEQDALNTRPMTCTQPK